MSKRDVYKFNSYTNVKAIIDFLEGNGGSEKDLNLFDVWLLSYLVNLYLRGDSLKKKDIGGEKYIFVSDTLILQNLRFSPGVRQVKNVISKLEKLGFIKRHIEGRRMRFIAINKKFLKLWEVESWSYSPVSFLMKYGPEQYKSIQNSFRPKLENYNILLEKFNDNYIIEGKAFDVKMIYRQLFSYLMKCAE